MFAKFRVWLEWVGVFVVQEGREGQGPGRFSIVKTISSRGLMSDMACRFSYEMRYSVLIEPE